MPHRERYLFVCTNRREEGNPKGSCAQSGSEELVKLLKSGMAARGLGKRMRACASGCLDLCELGAAIVQEPEHVVYKNVTAADVPDIIAALAEGRICERLVADPSAASPPAEPSKLS